jgi:hypothetical protein
MGVRTGVRVHRANHDGDRSRKRLPIRPALLEIGRVMFPLFGFVLAHNLSRPGAREFMPRMLLRLLPSPLRRR